MLYDHGHQPRFSPPISLWQLLFSPASLNLPPLGSSHTGSPRALVLLCLAYTLSTMFSRLILLQLISELQHFLCLKNSPVHIYTTFCLSTHLLLDVWVVSIFRLLWTLVYKDLSLCLQFFWGSPRMALLDHTVTLFPWGPAKLPSTVAAPSRVPSSPTSDPHLLLLPANTCSSPFLLTEVILMALKCYPHHIHRFL